MLLERISHKKAVHILDTQSIILVMLLPLYINEKQGSRSAAKHGCVMLKGISLLTALKKIGACGLFLQSKKAVHQISTE